MALKEKDFVEVEFIGKIKDGGVFDSNIKSELANLNPKAEAKPFIFPLGQGMFLKGVEDFLIGKETGKHELELSPENAFGKRNSQLIQLVPLKVFYSQKVMPVPGAVFNFDGRVGKVLSNSGGRVRVDFNHPLAGKNLIYNVNVLRQVSDINEQIKAMNEFLFRKNFNFEIKENSILMEVEKPLVKFVELFKDKFKEIFGKELSIKEIEDKVKAGKDKE